MCDRALAPCLYGNLLAVMRAAGEGGIDAARCRNARHNRLVTAVDTVIGKLRGETFMRWVRLRHDKQPRCFLVDPVDNAGPRDAANARKTPGAMMQEGVDQCAVEIPCRRVNDQPGGLVDDKEMLVLEDDFERNVLRNIMRRNGVGDVDVEMGSSADFYGRIADRPAFSPHMPGGNQRFYSFPGQRRDTVRQCAVEPPPDMIRAQCHRKSGKTCIHRYRLGVMQVRMTSELHAALLTEAAASAGAEVCGLLIGGDRIDAIVPTANIAEDLERAFEIDPSAVFAAIRTERAGGPKLLGYYHSHVKGPPEPSASDHAQAAGDGRIWLIIGQGLVTAWVSHRAGELRHADLIVDAP
jgi:desampylase